MKKILCIDDETNILNLLRRILEGAGYEVATTSEPQDALSVLERENPDLVVLDVQMPGVSGLEIFDELKNRNERYPVLFATGYPSAFHLDSTENIERYEKGFADGRTDVLYKPFQPKDVREKVDSLIGLADLAG